MTWFGKKNEIIKSNTKNKMVEHAYAALLEVRDGKAIEQYLKSDGSQYVMTDPIVLDEGFEEYNKKLIEKIDLLLFLEVTTDERHKLKELYSLLSKKSLDDIQQEQNLDERNQKMKGVQDAVSAIEELYRHKTKVIKQMSDDVLKAKAQDCLVNYRDTSQDSFVSLSVAKGNLEFLGEENHGFNLDAINERGETALNHALMGKSELLVQKLFNAGAKPTEGRNVLHQPMLLSIMPYKTVMSLVLKNTTDEQLASILNSTDFYFPKNFSLSLTHDVKKSCKEEFKSLIDRICGMKDDTKKKILQAREGNYGDFLSVAIEIELDFEVLKKLIDNGADITVRATKNLGYYVRKLKTETVDDAKINNVKSLLKDRKFSNDEKENLLVGLCRGLTEGQTLDLLSKTELINLIKVDKPSVLMLNYMEELLEKRCFRAFSKMVELNPSLLELQNNRGDTLLHTLCKDNTSNTYEARNKLIEMYIMQDKEDALMVKNQDGFMPHQLSIAGFKACYKARCKDLDPKAAAKLLTDMIDEEVTQGDRGMLCRDLWYRRDSKETFSSADLILDEKGTLSSVNLTWNRKELIDMYVIATHVYRQNDEKRLAQFEKNNSGQRRFLCNVGPELDGEEQELDGKEQEFDVKNEDPNDQKYGSYAISKEDYKGLIKEIKDKKIAIEEIAATPTDAPAAAPKEDAPAATEKRSWARRAVIAAGVAVTAATVSQVTGSHANKVEKGRSNNRQGPGRS